MKCDFARLIADHYCNSKYQIMGFLCWGLGELGVSFRILGEYDRCFVDGEAKAKTHSTDGVRIQENGGRYVT